MNQIEFWKNYLHNKKDDEQSKESLYIWEYVSVEKIVMTGFKLNQLFAWIIDL